MPRIPDDNLDAVFYLYRNRADADASVSAGGTGFLVMVNSTNFPDHVAYVYAITNWHVAVRDGYSVIRLNTKDGGTEIFDFGPEDWEFEQGGDDIAVLQIPLSDKHKFRAVPVSLILAKAQVSEIDLGLGDDVFMVGRFVDHDGGRINVPAVRFGNISVMPSPIKQATGSNRDSFCLDLHSRTGYSGSPVFFYRTPGTNIAETFRNKSASLSGTMLYLLGIHWGQFGEQWEIKEKLSGDESNKYLVSAGEKYVSGVSGMTCVIPAWRIVELLNLNKLKKQRFALDAEHEREFRARGFPPVTESMPSHDNLSHKEDFNNLLDAAVRGKP